MKKEQLVDYLQRAKGYLFPSLEPFGIAPVEALAAGCPVIAFNKGGSLDYIKDGVNGTFFDKQTVNSLVKGIQKFETMKFDKIGLGVAKNFDYSRAGFFVFIG